MLNAWAHVVHRCTPVAMVAPSIPQQVRSVPGSINMQQRFKKSAARAWWAFHQLVRQCKDPDAGVSIDLSPESYTVDCPCQMNETA
jgi:hypothetical protein